MSRGHLEMNATSWKLRLLSRDRLIKGIRSRMRNALRLVTPKTKTVEPRLEFLLSEVSELRSQMRELLAERRGIADQTKESFSYQWQELTYSKHMLGDPAFQRDMFGLIEQYTGHSASTFRNQSVLDAGCGNGRWSYAFAKLGAKVTAIDQSEAGIAVLRESAASAGLQIDARTGDVLNDSLPSGFDFVWCFGVVHHTGNTKRAIANIASAVRPGGMLYLMVYGEPVEPGDFIEVNLYEQLRRETSHMTFREKVDYLSECFPAGQVHGYFDAVSPTINDLHRFDALRKWLVGLGFGDVKRTMPGRNHHVVATRVGA